jgi:hypothetical protein
LEAKIKVERLNVLFYQGATPGISLGKLSKQVIYKIFISKEDYFKKVRK